MHSNFQGLLGNFNKDNTITGYTHKIDLLRDVLTFNNSPSIFCVTESKLSCKIPDNKLAINGYSLFRHDRNFKGGGVAICCTNLLNLKLKLNLYLLLRLLQLKFNALVIFQ